MSKWPWHRVVNHQLALQTYTTVQAGQQYLEKRCSQRVSEIGHLSNHNCNLQFWILESWLMNHESVKFWILNLCQRLQVACKEVSDSESELLLEVLVTILPSSKIMHMDRKRLLLGMAWNCEAWYGTKLDLNLNLNNYIYIMYLFYILYCFSFFVDYRF